MVPPLHSIGSDQTPLLDRMSNKQGTIGLTLDSVRNEINAAPEGEQSHY